jgi:malonate transporter MadL subunit
MRIYGVALLAGCFLAGQLIGVLLGQWIGIGGNVGGVGFGMLLLIYLNGKLGDMSPTVVKTKDGIFFWSSMYIPIVIAMSATQNVKAAVSGGWVAVLAGILATVICFLLIPFITSFIKHKEEV